MWECAVNTCMLRRHWLSKINHWGKTNCCIPIDGRRIFVVGRGNIGICATSLHLVYTQICSSMIFRKKTWVYILLLWAIDSCSNGNWQTVCKNTNGWSKCVQLVFLQFCVIFFYTLTQFSWLDIFSDLLVASCLAEIVNRFIYQLLFCFAWMCVNV